MWQQALVILSLTATAMSLGVLALAISAARHVGEAEERQGTTLAAGVISVVVPARNEESDVERGLLSILAQENVDLRVIAVNDHSTDRTGAILESLAAADHRLTVIHDPPLEPGWFGKCNAMEHGVALATGEYLALCDADVVHSRRSLASALAELQRDDLDFISYIPRLVCESFWENVTLAPFGLVSLALLGGARVNDPASSDAVAAGALILMRRRVLRDVGGFVAVKNQMLDDVALARTVKSRGYRVRLRLAPRLLEVRMFKGNRQAFWGPTKNILAFLGHPWLALPALMLPVLVYWVPLAALAAGSWHRNPLLLAAGGSTYLVHILMILHARKISRLRWTRAAFFPLLVLPLVCCGMRALYYRFAKGSVQWRGRTIPLQAPRN